MNLLRENRINQLLLKVLMNMFDSEKEVSEEQVTEVVSEPSVENTVTAPVE